MFWDRLTTAVTYLLLLALVAVGSYYVGAGMGYVDGYRKAKIDFAFKAQRKRWITKYGREWRP